MNISVVKFCLCLSFNNKKMSDFKMIGLQLMQTNVPVTCKSDSYKCMLSDNMVANEDDVVVAV